MRGKYHKTQCVIKSKPMSFNICSCFGARKSELSNLSLMVLRLSIPSIKLFANNPFESFYTMKIEKKYSFRICQNKIRYPFTLWNSYSTTYPKTHTRHLVKEIMTKHLWQMKMMKWVFIYIIYFSPSVRYHHFKIRIYSFCYIGHKKNVYNLHIYVINFSMYATDIFI